VSVPPDQFDENGEPIEPDTFDEGFVAWRADSDPPEWFYQAGDILGFIEEHDAVNLNIDPYDSDFTTNAVVLHTYDEDTGDEMYWPARYWSKEDWMEFYDYTSEYYDTAFWSEHYTPDML
jgi:hypothetical protein